MPTKADCMCELVTFPGHHGEEVLVREPAVIWLHGDTLTVEPEGENRASTFSPYSKARK
jgi:hypothetical protein